jgi:hypothetical protein
VISKYLPQVSCETNRDRVADELALLVTGAIENIIVGEVLQACRLAGSQAAVGYWMHGECVISRD